MGLVSLFFLICIDPVAEEMGSTAQTPASGVQLSLRHRSVRAPLELTTGFHSLHEARDSQLNAANVVCRAGVLEEGPRESS